MDFLFCFVDYNYSIKFKGWYGKLLEFDLIITQKCLWGGYKFVKLTEKSQKCLQHGYKLVKLLKNLVGWLARRRGGTTLTWKRDAHYRNPLFPDTFIQVNVWVRIF